jgi:mono/diheme cytochrome c family protein
VLTAVGLIAASAARASSQTPAKGRTVWDGVYTEAQATRATGVFGASCAGCHALTAQGNRPLSGEKFWQSYTQRTVADLLTYVSKNMPNGNGGSLSPDSYNDIVALILQSNGLPAGTTELRPDTIASVQIVPKDGSSVLPANTLVRVVGCLARSGSDWTLTNATAPIRAEKTGVDPSDATTALGTGTMTLKFVLTKLDSFVGQRMSVSGILIGTGGVDGINVAVVSRVAETCP